MAGTGPETDRDSIEQFYITHCLYNEGVHRRAGFGVRACSSRDPLVVRFVEAYPPYEAPAGVDARRLRAAAAPRRLALVEVPGERMALIHSAYLRDEERGRANNFFSHAIITPALTAAVALATWASTDWVTSYGPGALKELAPLEGLPRPGPVNDAAVTAFLEPVVAITDQHVATSTCPPRLAAAAQRRRELIAVTLYGCMLVLQASPGAPRGRFYILAEPGLTALLLYATARLLPPALTANLTFSTYEDAQRCLRTYRHARVVGTYLADPAKGLEEEFFSTRGYALDTFGHRWSPELGAAGEPEVGEWIELASRGEWATLDKMHGLLGSRVVSVVSLREGAHAAKLARRLITGQAQVEDLLALKRSALGEPVLEEHLEYVWPLVRDASLSNVRVREAFASMLRQGVPELEQRAAQVLRADPPADWQPHWRLLRSVLEDDPAKLRESFQRILPEPPYPQELRFELLQELRTLELSPAEQSASLNTLLRGCSAEELERFAGSDLSREWFARVLCYALGKAETRATAVGHLHGGDDRLVRAFWEQFKLLKEEPHRRAILASVFLLAESQGASFLSRMLTNRCAIRPETMEWLLLALGAFKTDWAAFWGRDNHLGLLLDVLREFGEESAPVWGRLCDQLNRDLLVPGEPYQRTLLMGLAAATVWPGPAVPEKAAQVVRDWVGLREHFEKAAAVPEPARQALLDACSRLNLDGIDVVAGYFERFLLPQGMNREVLDDFAGFFHSFFREGTEHQNYSARLIAWLHVVRGAAEEAVRAAYQQYYLDNHVPLEFRWQLADETYKAGKLLSAVYQAVPKPTEPATDSARPGLDELFQLSGLHPPDTGELPLLSGALKRSTWLICSLAGCAAAALLARVYRIPDRSLAALALFVPAVVTLTEAMATQGVGLSVRGLRPRPQAQPALPQTTRRDLLIAVLLALCGGLLAGGLAALVSGTLRLASCVGPAVAGGMAGAAAFGRALPGLLRRLHWDERTASGPVSRAVAALAALLLYFTLARWLLG
jgi:hypothetical protein